MEDFSEFQHKMCKKVAQLTKVIFHLNTKNDEYEYNIRSVVSSYETEMVLFFTNYFNIIIYKF